MESRRLFHLRDSRPDVDESIAWELGHHLEERIDELVEQGYSPDEAREVAMRSFGSMDRVRRELLDIDRSIERSRVMFRMLDDLVQDIRYGLRGVGLNPGIAAGVVLTLALGIGANAAMFSVVDALLLRPLPYSEPNELMEIGMVTPPNEFVRTIVPYDVARTWQEQQEWPVMLHSRMSVLLTGSGEPQDVTLQAVTPEFNELFGVAPMLGRAFLPDDADPSSPDIVLLDYGFWQTSLGGARDAIGRTVTLDGTARTIIGVMPKGFRYPTYATTAGWVPIRSDGILPGTSARTRFIYASMRVPIDVQPAVTAQAATVGAALFREIDPASESMLRLQSMNEGRGGNADTRQAMLLLSGAVVMILLVAGVNMVNLLLARGSARTGEMAIRMAVGAARGRIVRQIATEAMLLAILGGAAAVIVALVVVRALQGIMPTEITFFAPYAIAIEQRTLLFTFVVAVSCGLVFGLIPALGAPGWAQQHSGSALTRYASRTRGSRQVRRGLVVVEVAFSVILLVTASLLINSFVRLMRVDPGMDFENMAVLTFSVSSTTYPTAGDRGAYLRHLEERIVSLPGVQSAAVTSGLPPRAGGLAFGLTLEAEGSPAKPRDDSMILPLSDVGATFFDVTGARLIAGRPFLGNEDRTSGNVIIDEDLARHLWPGGSATDRRFRLRPGDDWLTVVGVMADLRLFGPDERRGEFVVLYPAGNYDALGGQVTMAIRTRGDTHRVLNAVRATVHEVNPDQPIQDLVPASTYYATAVAMPKFLAVLMGILAALGLTLAAVGVHGVLAFGVAQRKHELGVRMVLGARASEMGRLVVGEGVVLAMIGIAIGIAGALLSTRIVQGVLYGVDAADPMTFAAAIAGVLLIVAAATLRPAQRAARLDPLEVLRTQ